MFLQAALPFSVNWFPHKQLVVVYLNTKISRKDWSSKCTKFILIEIVVCYSVSTWYKLFGPDLFAYNWTWFCRIEFKKTKFQKYDYRIKFKKLRKIIWYLLMFKTQYRKSLDSMWFSWIQDHSRMLIYITVICSIRLFSQ